MYTNNLMRRRGGTIKKTIGGYIYTVAREALRGSGVIDFILHRELFI